jgi:hypothetical protein
MCHRCADIDYPIGDVIWLPCGGPSSRYRGKERPARGYSDADGDGWAKVQELVATIKRQAAEINRLHLHEGRRSDSRESFEGVE